MGTKRIDREGVESFIHSIPKTEIHLHLEGLAGVDTIWKLKQKNKLSFPGVESRDDLVKRFQVNSLDEFIDLFINVIQNCFQEEQDIAFLVDDARRYLIDNNIRYAEIFFAPSKFVINGFSFSHIVDILDEGAQKLKEDTGIEIRYIMDVSRSFGRKNAMRNLNLTLSNPKKSIIGIGLGGSESQGPAEDYIEVFSQAKAAGLHVVAHAGEDVGPDSVWSTIENLEIERIGHGISSIQDPKLMDLLAERQIPLEVCPTSNLFTRKYVKSYEEHPIRPFFDHGINVTLNTDDPTIFGVELVEEYGNMYEHGLFSVKELVELIRKGIYATFLPKERQDELWAAAKQAVNTHGDPVLLPKL
jgi:adenosine deaminase